MNPRQNPYETGQWCGLCQNYGRHTTEQHPSRYEARPIPGSNHRWWEVWDHHLQERTVAFFTTDGDMKALAEEYANRLNRQGNG